MPIVKTDTTITAHEAAQLERANTSIGQIAEHLAEVIGGLAGKPVVIGHSFWRAAGSDPGWPRPGNRVGGNRPGPLPGCAPLPVSG